MIDKEYVVDMLIDLQKAINENTADVTDLDQKEGLKKGNEYMSLAIAIIRGESMVTSSYILAPCVTYLMTLKLLMAGMKDKELDKALQYAIDQVKRGLYSEG